MRISTTVLKVCKLMGIVGLAYGTVKFTIGILSVTIVGLTIAFEGFGIALLSIAVWRLVNEVMDRT